VNITICLGLDRDNDFLPGNDGIVDLGGCITVPCGIMFTRLSELTYQRHPETGHNSVKVLLNFARSERRVWRIYHEADTTSEKELVQAFKAPKYAYQVERMQPLLLVKYRKRNNQGHFSS